MMGRRGQAVLAAAILAAGLAPSGARAGWIAPDSWATYEWQYFNPPPPDEPYGGSYFDSGSGGGTRRNVYYDAGNRFDPYSPSTGVESGATFSLAGWKSGTSVRMEISAVFADGWYSGPGIFATLFGTNGPLVTTDFEGHHDGETLLTFAFPLIDSGPPDVRYSDITAIIEAIAGRYSHLGIIFTSSTGNQHNDVDFDVRLGGTFVPEPSSLVMSATAALVGLAAVRRGSHRESGGERPGVAGGGGGGQG